MRKHMIEDSMHPFDTLVYSQMIGKRVHFKCDCLFPIDFIGTVIGFKLNDGVLSYEVLNNDKTIYIELTHPNMRAEIL